MRINITSNGTIWQHVPSDMNYEKQNIISMVFLLKICNSYLITTSNLRDIQQNKWPILFKNVKVTKDKEKLRKCSGLKVTEETC